MAEQLALLQRGDLQHRLCVGLGGVGQAVKVAHINIKGVQPRRNAEASRVHRNGTGGPEGIAQCLDRFAHRTVGQFPERELLQQEGELFAVHGAGRAKDKQGQQTFGVARPEPGFCPGLRISDAAATQKVNLNPRQSQEPA